MSFATSRLARLYEGNLVWEFWSYTSSGGATGGTVTTGLKRVLFAKPIEKDSSAMAALAVLNESSFPTDNTIAIKTTANKSGWLLTIGDTS